MLRVEIISNQSVEDDIKEALLKELPELEYSVLPVVNGKGRNTEKLGTTVWPEVNFILFTYTDEETAGKIASVIKGIKEKFPKEGITIYASQALEL